MLSAAFVRNIIKMSLGVIFSQAILILVSPLITRLYTPAALGVMGVFASGVSVCSAFANGRYQVPIVLPKRDREAINIFMLSVLIAVVVFAILQAIIFFFKSSIVSGFGFDDQMAIWLYLIPFSVLLSGLFEPLNAWFVRKKKYLHLSGAKMSNSIGMSVVQVGAGALNLGAGGLIAGRVFGDGLRVAYLGFQFNKEYRNRVVFLSLNSIKNAAIKYKDFLRYEAVLTFARTLSTELPIFLLSGFFGVSSTGFYLLSVRVISSPFSILELSMNQVFYREIVERYHRREDLYAFVKKTYWTLFKFAIIPHCIALVAMPYIFKFVFGAVWVTSGVMTQWMVPALLLSFLNSPVTTISQVLNKQKTLLVASLIQLSGVWGLMWLSAIWFHSVIVTVGFLGISLAVYQGFLMWYLLYLAKHPYSDIPYN